MKTFTEIGQFRNVIRDVKSNSDYQGKDGNGDAIYLHNKPYSTLLFRGTVKTHGCLDENTLITLANGEEIKISEIKIGTYVLSFNTENKNIKTNKVINIINNVSNKEWCRLIFDDRNLICTKDHKVWTKNRGYVEAYNLLNTDEFEII